MGKTPSVGALQVLENALQAKITSTRGRPYAYTVPSLWRNPAGAATAETVSPFDYYLDVVHALRAATPPPAPPSTGGEWTKDAVIYNMFVRTTTAFDHNGNGRLDLPVNADGFRETGTFLKAMAMLPYIKRLGATTVHLLPVTSIGHDGNKGTLGSPYAIRNPYTLDENLAESALGLDVQTEFRAFVEAAHNLGLRVVVEFVFRTAAKDGDWVKEHPEWLYWIKDSVPPRAPNSTDETTYGSPLFTPEELHRIHDDVNHKRFGNLTPPHPVYRGFFTAPPRPERVVKEGGRYVGTLDDGTRVRIPGAFADWPPDDNQPPWNDVTYLRMYTHPEFNYIGYNTIRMYDSRLTRPQYVNRPLWDKVVGIIPHYQKEFHIDGVMIDMGHALPMELKAEMVRTARQNNPDFAFWDENFSITRRSREEGYNAVFGYLWADQHHPDKFRRFLGHLAGEGFPIPFFTTPESHNTPRAAARPGGVAYARWSIVMNSFLPGVPFIHSGFEIAEEYPINTGLDFTTADQRRYPSERLPLFSEYAYHWLNPRQFVGWVETVLRLRARYHALVTDQHPPTFLVLDEGNGHVVSYTRRGGEPERRIGIVGSTNYHGEETSATRVATGLAHVADLLGGGTYPVHDGMVRFRLAPGQCVVFEF